MQICQRGHEFTPENTYVRPDGRRRCKRCQNERMAAARARRAAVSPPRERVQRLCLIEGCDRPHACHGWCVTHYRRWVRTGSTADPTPFTPEPCGVADCDRDARRNGYCEMHSFRYARYGDPETVKIIRDNLARFESKIDREGPLSPDRPDLGPCWLWNGVRNWAGYGRFKVDGANVQAHRWSYEHWVGPIPSGLEIDHLCFVTYCVRPDHLEPVTRLVNQRRASTRR